MAKSPDDTGKWWTTKEILKTWQDLKDMARTAFSGKTDPDLPDRDLENLKKEVSDCIFSRMGVVTGRACVIGLGTAYINLSDKGKARFLRMLAKDFDVDPKKLKEAVRNLNNASNPAQETEAEIALAGALAPPRLRLLRRFNALPDGFKFLADMRADLLSVIGEDPSLKKLDLDLKELLSAWFEAGELDLEEITWRSSAALLEKLIDYEAAQEIKSWTDMRNRLDSDRRCFAFFHPEITHEPLLFIEIALVNEMPGSIMKLWDQESSAIKAREAQAAVLYAVTNTQKGLAGIRLGDFLIKRVIEKLSRELANIRHFATLSPVPGFRPWLVSRLEAADTGILLDIDVEVIQTLSGSKNTAPGFLTLLKSDWHINPDLADPLGHILMRLCANYLLNVRRENGAHDPVAHFHFVNGARLERLNWLADKSKKGLSQSFGIMANYVYRPGEIEENHEQYASGKALSASKEVRALLKPAS